ncbi:MULTISPECIES: hypothetical protein [Bradyrhizobium]|uniref:Uncharacterized protein n=1 Tax=Bradyrhizobium vignae TaxID=1549949 RepID=A0ABS3ZVD3_9BRAD|nr:hypothetical protein [Bradyrhizobium vignae]MBP0111688.1 hypothetical protein [Bradyrhizobium vignae]
MTSITKSASIAGWLLGRIADWFERFRESADIRALSASEIESIARDLRVQRAELEALIAHGRHGAKELSRLLDVFGIDERSIARKQPGVLHDLTMVCALCASKPRCNRETRAGTAALQYPEYCPNAYTIDALRKESLIPQAVDFLRRPACC